MPEIDIAAIRARADAATPGPWHAYPLDEGGYGVSGEPDVGDVAEVYEREDAEFISNVRTDIPTLLAEVERLRAEVETIRSVARGNKRHVATITEYAEQVAAELDALRASMLAVVDAAGYSLTLEEEAEQDKAAWSGVALRIAEDVAAASAAQDERAAMRPVVEAAQARARVLRQLHEFGSGSLGWAEADRESDQRIFNVVKAYLYGEGGAP